MNKHGVCFLLSLLACLIGFIMVLIFTYLYVVPFRLSKEIIYTSCHVIEFPTKMHTNLNSTIGCSKCLSDYGQSGHYKESEWLQSLDMNSTLSCLVVKVMYRRLDGAWDTGMLSSDSENTGYPQVQNVDTPISKVRQGSR